MRILERLTKCMMCVGLIPFIWTMLIMIAIFLLFMPLVAFISPDTVKFKEKGEKDADDQSS